MKIGIIGAGAYAIALASLLEEKELKITMWTRLEEEYQELITNHTNSRSLNYKLNNKIKFTKSLQELSEESNTLILAIPAKFVKQTIEELKPFYKNQELLIATKGMIENPIHFINEYLEDTLKSNKITCIYGPSFANDVIKKYPIGLTLSSQNRQSLEYFKALFSNISYLSTEITADIKGTEICSILKNIIAIGAGILNGMEINSSTKAKFLIDTSYEIQKIIKELKGDYKTFYTYAGLGDFLLTTTSENSRNYTFGTLIGSNKNYKSYMETTTIEGLENLNGVYNFLNEQKIDCNIINILYEIIYLRKDKSNILKYLENKE